MSRPAASALARAAGGAAVPLRASCEARAGGLKLRLDDSAPASASAEGSPAAAGAGEAAFAARPREAAPLQDAPEAGLREALDAPGRLGVARVLALDLRYHPSGASPGGSPEVGVEGELVMPAAPLRLKPLLPLPLCDTGLSRTLRFSMGRGGGAPHG